jgi:hypothetical protein
MKTKFEYLKKIYRTFELHVWVPAHIWRLFLFETEITFKPEITSETEIISKIFTLVMKVDCIFFVVRDDAKLLDRKRQKTSWGVGEGGGAV